MYQLFRFPHTLLPLFCLNCATKTVRLMVDAGRENNFPFRPFNVNNNPSSFRCGLHSSTCGLEICVWRLVSAGRWHKVYMENYLPTARAILFRAWTLNVSHRMLSCKTCWFSGAFWEVFEPVMEHTSNTFWRHFYTLCKVLQCINVWALKYGVLRVKNKEINL